MTMVLSTSCPPNAISKPSPSPLQCVTAVSAPGGNLLHIISKLQFCHHQDQVIFLFLPSYHVSLILAFTFANSTTYVTNVLVRVFTSIKGLCSLFGNNFYNLSQHYSLMFNDTKLVFNIYYNM